MILLPHSITLYKFLIYFFHYLTSNIIFTGISVPAGLVVPMLLIGGSYGRLVGLGALQAKKSMCTNYSELDADLAFSNTYYWSTYTRWMVSINIQNSTFFV